MHFDPALNALQRQNIAMPFISQRRYIDLTSYLPTSDLLDAWDGFQAAFNDGEDREIVVTKAHKRSRNFRFLSSLKGPLTLPKRSKLILEPGVVLDFSPYGKSRAASTGINYIQRGATLLGTRNVLVNVPAGTKVINIPSGAVIPKGYVMLQSTDLFTDMEATLGTRGEWVYVVKSSATQITLAGQVLDNYLTSAGNITLAWFDMPKVHIENLNVLGPGTLTDVGATPKLGDRALRLFHCLDTVIDGGDINFCDNGGVDFVGCPHGVVRNLRVAFDDLPARDRNQYGITHGGTSEDWLIENSQVFGGKEAFALSSTGGAGEWYYRQGITRRIKYSGNLARGAWRSGYCTHHNHERIDWFHNIAEDCEQGMDIRIQNVVAQGNIFRRMGQGQGNLDCGIQLASGVRNIRLEGNLYDDCLRGIFMSQNIEHERTPGDFVIRNETMRGIRMIYGVDMAHAGSAAVPVDAALGAVTIEGLDFAGRTDAGSGVIGVRLRGKWTIPKVQGRFKGGTGASPAVSMSRSADSTAADGGSISPMVDIECTAGFTGTTILHTSGVIKKRVIGIGHTATEEV